MDKKLEGMCEKCITKANDKTTCSSCGDKLPEAIHKTVNKNFDNEKYERLMAEKNGGGQ